MKRLATVLIAAALIGIGIAAAVDVFRSDGEQAADNARPEEASGAAPVEREEELQSADARLTTALEDEGVTGVLYYSNTRDECRLDAVTLPDLVQAPPPKLRACRFDLPAEPESTWLPAGVTWQREARLAARCRRGSVDVVTRADRPVYSLRGCSPAWKPDGTLTLVRDGEVWSFRIPCLPAELEAGGCERRILARRELRRAARFDPIVPALRYVASVAVTDVAWLGDTRAALLLRVRLRGQLRGLGPQTMFALYEGRRLVTTGPHAAANELRVSPRRGFVAVYERGGRITIRNRTGRLSGPAALPSPNARAVAWSPDERWTAVATRWSVYVFASGETQPRFLRLPITASDLAWR